KITSDELPQILHLSCSNRLLLRWCSRITSDYIVSAYLPQSTIIDNNHLISLAFTSGITPSQALWP
ncbi:MAG: hypothetical protein WAW42_20445, partial [Candidatus Competibacteraceae bacterium]